MYRVDHHNAASRDGFLAEMITQAALLEPPAPTVAATPRKHAPPPTADPSATPAALLALLGEARAELTEKLDHPRDPLRGDQPVGRGCPSVAREEPLGITPLEAFASAAELRCRNDRSALSAIRRRLVEAAERSAALVSSLPSNQAAPCGLCSADATCQLGDARPLMCVALAYQSIRAEAIAPSPDRRLMDFEHVETMAATTQADMRRSLATLGIDMALYEVSSAVLRALNVPGAMRRWLQGEDVFRGCLCVERFDPRHSFSDELAPSMLHPLGHRRNGVLGAT